MRHRLGAYWDKGLVRLLALSVALGAITGMHGCTQPTNAQVDQKSEIERFMELSQDIKELLDFNVYARDTFVLDSGDITFRVAKIDTKRPSGNSITVSDDTTKIVTSFAEARFATVSREDIYLGTFVQQNSPTGQFAEDFYDARLKREVLFLKLGSNDAPFLGWELMAVDLGKPLGNISDFVTIRKIPLRGGFPTVLSNQQQETDLPVTKRNFTFVSHIKSVRAGDSIDILTKVGPMTIFARTNVGFRQLSGRPTAPNQIKMFNYGFRAPKADPLNQFYHLLTFQTGPEEVIDSTKYNRFISTIIVTPIVPPDTLFTPVFVPDTVFDSTFDFIDTCANPDTLINDTFIINTCIIRELFRVDSLFGSRLAMDTTVFSSVSDTFYDSILLPPDTQQVFEDLWVFPYSVK